MSWRSNGSFAGTLSSERDVAVINHVINSAGAVCTNGVSDWSSNHPSLWGPCICSRPWWTDTLMMVDGHDQPQVLTKIWHSSFVDQFTSLELSGDAQTFGMMGGSQQTDSQLTDWNQSGLWPCRNTSWFVCLSHTLITGLHYIPEQWRCFIILQSFSFLFSSFCCCSSVIYWSADTEMPEGGGDHCHQFGDCRLTDRTGCSKDIRSFSPSPVKIRISSF